jgi:hypothetical protein
MRSTLFYLADFLVLFSYFFTLYRWKYSEAGLAPLWRSTLFYLADSLVLNSYFFTLYRWKYSEAG